MDMQFLDTIGISVRDSGVANLIETIFKEYTAMFLVNLKTDKIESAYFSDTIKDAKELLAGLRDYEAACFKYIEKCVDPSDWDNATRYCRISYIQNELKDKKTYRRSFLRVYNGMSLYSEIVYIKQGNDNEYPEKVLVTFRQNDNSIRKELEYNHNIAAKEKELLAALNLAKEREESMLSVDKALGSGRWQLEVGADGRITDWFVSKEIKQLLGYGLDDDMDNRPINWISIIHPADIQRAHDVFKQMISGKPELGNCYSLEYRICSKAKEYIWFRAVCYVVHKSNGCQTVYGAAINIDNEKRSSLISLQTDSFLLEQYGIINALSRIYIAAYYIDIGRDSSFELTAKAYIHGHLGNEEVASEVLSYFAYNVSDDMFRDDLLTFFDLGTLASRLKGKSYISQTFICKDALLPDQFAGNKSWAECSFMGVKSDENGNHTHVIFAIKDVNQIMTREIEHQQALKIALEEAKEANRAKTTFLSNMSHDIRTPMNAIMGFAALAKDSIQNPAQVHSYLDKISMSSTHLLSLINDVLDMSRIESGKVTFNEKVENLPVILSEIESMMKADMQSHQLSFQVVAEKIVNQNIFCDKLRLKQIFLNLLSNAMKYNKIHGRVVFKVRQLKRASVGYGAYEFIVRDNGIGMDADFLKHVFDPFERAASGISSNIQGTGLGMTITKSLVELMGGTINVSSVPDKGTEIVVLLPFRIGVGKWIAKKKKRVEDYCFSGLRILVAEDNLINQEIINALLMKTGAEVEIANNGEACVRKIAESSSGYYDCILMDIQMPCMDGYKATKCIRALEDDANSRIPIIAMTANAFLEDRQRAFAVGMDEHITKPIMVEELYRAIFDRIFLSR